MVDTQKVFRAHVDGEPTPMSELGMMDEGNVLEGNPNSRINVIREGTSGDKPMMAGIIWIDPCVVQEVTEYDEVIQVLEGSLEIDKGDEVVSLEAGDCVSISRGLKATWRIKTPVKELFIAIDPG